MAGCKGGIRRDEEGDQGISQQLGEGKDVLDKGTMGG